MAKPQDVELLVGVVRQPNGQVGYVVNLPLEQALPQLAAMQAQLLVNLVEERTGTEQRVVVPASGLVPA
jgi:hypothetical protein